MESPNVSFHDPTLPDRADPGPETVSRRLDDEPVDLADLEDDVQVEPAPAPQLSGDSGTVHAHRHRLKRLDKAAHPPSLQLDDSMQGSMDEQAAALQEGEALEEPEEEGQGEAEEEPDEEDYAWDEEDEYAKQIAAEEEAALAKLERARARKQSQTDAGVEGGDTGDGSGSGIEEEEGDEEGNLSGAEGAGPTLRDRGGQDRIGGGVEQAVEAEGPPLEGVLARLKNRKAQVAARAAKERGLAVDVAPIQQPEPTPAPTSPIDFSALLARVKAKQRVNPPRTEHPAQQSGAPDIQLPTGATDPTTVAQVPTTMAETDTHDNALTVSGRAQDHLSAPADLSFTIADQPTVQAASPAPEAAAVEVTVPCPAPPSSVSREPTPAAAPPSPVSQPAPDAATEGTTAPASDKDMVAVEDDDDLEIVGHMWTPGKPNKAAATTDDQVLAALDQPAQDVAVLRPPPRPTVEDGLQCPRQGGKKVFSRTGMSSSRLARLGSVTLVNHGVAVVAKRQDSLSDPDASKPVSASDQQPNREESLPGVQEGDEVAGSGLVETDEHSEEEEGGEEEELGSGSARGSGSEEDEDMQGSDAEGVESEEEGEQGSGSVSEELEAEPLAYEEMEPEFEDKEAAGRDKPKTDIVRDQEAGVAKPARHKVTAPRPRGRNQFLEMEAELSDEDEGAVAVSEDEEEGDEGDDRMLDELIGNVREKQRDELKRARLHKEWLEKQDAHDMRAIVDGIRNGFKRPGKQMIGGEEGTDAEARRRRAMLFSASQLDDDDMPGEGVEEWALALQNAAQDGEDEEEEAPHSQHPAGEDAFTMRKRLRTTTSLPEPSFGPGVIPHVGSEEVRELVRLGRTASAGPLPAEHKPPAAPHRTAGAAPAGLPKPQAGAPFSIFGRELTNKPGAKTKAQGSSFVGKSLRGAGHRSTSNAGGRSFVFGVSEHSNTVDPDAATHKDASNGAATRPGVGASNSVSGKPASFAGVRSLLGSSAAASGVVTAVTVTKRESSTLFTLLESSSRSQM